MKPVCEVCGKEFVEGYLVIVKVKPGEATDKKQRVRFYCHGCAYLEKKKFEEEVVSEKSS